MRCSVVIPIYQEVQSVPTLHEALAKVAGATPGAWEFIFVDDGSRDGTWEALCALRAQDARVRAIRLARNFGQTEELACRVLGRDLGKADDVAAVIERDREAAEHVHATEDQWTLLVGRKHAAHTQRMGTDFEREPSPVYADTATLNAEEDVLGMPRKIHPELRFSNGGGDHRAIRAGVDQEIKRDIPTAARQEEQRHHRIGDLAERNNFGADGEPNRHKCRWRLSAIRSRWSARDG